MKKNILRLRSGLAFLILVSIMACTPRLEPIQDSTEAGADSQSMPLTIAIPPNEGERNLPELEKELKERVGEAVKILVMPEYKDLVSALADKRAHFAVLPPLVAVKAEEQTAIKFLLKKVYGQSDFYYSAIITTSVNSRVKNLEDLKGLKVAFVDPDSSSGYLYPKLMLSEAGLSESDIKAQFSGTHDKSVELVLSSQVDAAAVWANDPSVGGGAWSEKVFSSAQANSISVIKYSEPIPNDAIVVREDYYKSHPATVLKMMDALIYISEEKKILKEIFGIDSLTTATSAHYENVRKLQKVLNK